MSEKEKKAITVKASDVGRFVRIFYKDIWAMDGLITEVSGPTDFRFILLSNPTNGSESNNGCPILKLGAFISAEHSGLGAFRSRRIK